MKDDQVIAVQCDNYHVDSMTMKIMRMTIKLIMISCVAPSLVCVWLEGDGVVDEYDLH